MKLGKALYDWHIIDKNSEKCGTVVNSFYCVFLKQSQDIRENFYNCPENILLNNDSEVYFFETYLYIFVPKDELKEHCIIKIIPAIEHLEYQIFRDHKKLFSVTFDRREMAHQQVLDMKWCEATIKSVIQKCSVSNTVGFSLTK